MEDTDGGGVDERSGLQSRSDSQNEIVWSVGELCQAKWSGDGKLYTGTVKKLKHTKTGRVVALIKFSDYDSEDSEEVDVQLLRKMVKAKTQDNSDAGRAKGLSGSSEEAGGLFRPFTGREEVARLEDKYGQESDSDSDERSSMSGWISPTPYQTQGKVSEWKVRSPAKSQTASRSQRGKVAVVRGGSPRKKSGAGRKMLIQTGQKDRSAPHLTSPEPLRRAAASGASSTASADGLFSGTASAGEESRRIVRGRGAGLELDDSAFSPASREGLFEGFDEDDMEKPKFNFPAPSEKTPFCLDDNAQIPASLNRYLRDYQREGIRFLYSHFTANRGAILGDDMGLGKTVQVIGFLSALLGKKGNRQDVLRQKPRFIRLMSDTPDVSEDRKCRPFLIIGPGSVLYNWLEELDTWAYFTVRKYHGVDKASCLADVLRGKVEVVVTTFETCRDNIDALNEVKWEAVIVDEVHRIKGLKAQTTQALRTLKCVRRYGLTGTALQNNMSELWCLLDWAQPGVLGSAEVFKEEFVHPIELGQKQNATKRELAEARQKKEQFAKVRSRMLLRRTKKVIADQLPIKTDRVVFCRLTPLQVSVYKAVLSHPDMENVLRVDEDCACGSGQTRGKCCFKKLCSGRSHQSIMFSFMHVLLKTSNHVALLIPHSRMSPDQEQRAKKLCDTAFKDHPEFVALARDAAFRTLSDPKYCGKMKVLQGMLAVFAKSRSKVLVFSYSTRLLDILEQHIMSEGHEYRRIDGSVTGRRRQEIVREFNSDPNIFLCLVSTKAGGLGLNMTGANKVVIFDPNWNPSHDLQAQDRAYRIGQRRDVEVFRLISAGSIEENIYLRQIYKQQLDNVAIGTENARRYFQGIQGDTDNKGELFGVKNMFRLRTGDSCLTMDILNRNAKVEAGVAGYNVAEYIPSWREQQLVARDDTVEEEKEDSDGGGSASGAETSDEESLKALKDLFDDAASDDDEKEKQSATPKKHRPAGSREPQPSTSGFNTGSNKQPATSTRKRTIHDHNSDSESSAEESAARPSRPTTRQRKAQTRTGASAWGDRTNAADVLDFLDESDVAAGGEGKKSLGLKGKRNKSRGDVSGGTKTTSAQPPLEDSLVTPSFSSVSSVFEHCGVIHIHDNPAIVGASRVEDHMTRCALQDVFELSSNTQALALLCDPMSQPSEDESLQKIKAAVPRGKGLRRKAARGRTAAKDHNSARTVDHGHCHILVGQTPTAIRKKHWSRLKESKSCQDDVTLAQQVVVASSEERLAMLKEMYRRRHDNTLHGVLDDILSKPADPPEEAVEESDPGKAPAKSPTGKGQPRKGRRKVSQSKTTPAQKRPVRRKRAAPGLLYDNVDDTQPSQPPRKRTNPLEDDPSSDNSGFDIGAKVSPAKVKVTPRKRRGGTLCSGRTQPQSVISPTSFDRTDKAATSTSRVSWKVPDSAMDIPPNDSSSDVAEDVDGLLQELGQKPTNTAFCPKDLKQSSAAKPAPFCGQKRGGTDLPKDADTVSSAGGKPKFSVLDDIFLDPDDCHLRKQRPPPKRGQTSRTETSAGIQWKDSTADHSATPSTSRLKSIGRTGTSTSSEVFPDLMNNSTLLDDDVDCFGELAQWTKRQQKRKAPARKIDRLLQETTDNYLQLFESGHLVKKRQRERSAEQMGDRGLAEREEEVSKREFKRPESSELDPSGSLF